MTDYIEYTPKRHGQRPPYWTPDTPTGLDNKNFVRQPNWAWIAGTLYYVPYEAVYGVPRPAPVDVGADAAPVDIRPNCEMQANTIEELRAANERWVIAFKQAEERANGRIEALQADNARLREALRVYAGPMEWTQEGGWGMFPVWADGYPGGVYLDDNTLDFGDAAREALQETSDGQ